MKTIGYLDFFDWIKMTFGGQEKQLVFDVWKFAHTKHMFQTRRSNGQLYIRHPERVAIAVHGLKLSIEYTLAALLHDTSEDCGAIQGEIETISNPRVWTLVDFMDKKKIAPFPSYDEKLDHFVKKDPKSILLRLADSQDNFRDPEGFRSNANLRQAAKNALMLIKKAELIAALNEEQSTFLCALKELMEKFQ
jgi:(p)ppGpp synthase/HD superfamily hydrolase